MFSKNLKHLRKKNDLSQDYIADKLGYRSFTTIQKWESGQSEPSVEKLKLLASMFDVTMEELLNSDLTIPRDLSLLPDNSKAIRINVYGSIPAGIPIEAVEDIVDWEDIPREWTKGGQEYIGLCVKGDSMSPKYLDGDTVIIKLQPYCESGQDAAVYVNGYDATLKKVVKLENGILLQPLNPEYLPKEYDFNDDRDPEIIILGIVVEIRRKV